MLRMHLKSSPRKHVSITRASFTKRQIKHIESIIGSQPTFFAQRRSKRARPKPVYENDLVKRLSVMYQVHLHTIRQITASDPVDQQIAQVRNLTAHSTLDIIKKLEPAFVEKIKTDIVRLEPRSFTNHMYQHIHFAMKIQHRKSYLHDLSNAQFQEMLSDSIIPFSNFLHQNGTNKYSEALKMLIIIFGDYCNTSRQIKLSKDSEIDPGLKNYIGVYRWVRNQLAHSDVDITDDINNLIARGKRINSLAIDFDSLEKLIEPEIDSMDLEDAATVVTDRNLLITFDASSPKQRFR